MSTDQMRCVSLWNFKSKFNIVLVKMLACHVICWFWMTTCRRQTVKKDALWRDVSDVMPLPQHPPRGIEIVLILIGGTGVVFHQLQRQRPRLSLHVIGVAHQREWFVDGGNINISLINSLWPVPARADRGDGQLGLDHTDVAKIFGILGRLKTIEILVKKKFTFESQFRLRPI